MKTFDLNSVGVLELDKAALIAINGGSEAQPIPGPSIWWAVAAQAINAAIIVMTYYGNEYIKYSTETGGKYVFHHVI